VGDTLLRSYLPAECGSDGYPAAWHETIKHSVRERAGFRCIRCQHPYRNGEHGKGEWTRCDSRCTHYGLLRVGGWNGEVGEWGPGLCGVSAGEMHRAGAHVEAAWRILTVHHLDGDKRNCRWWNLSALCQRCHLQIQGRVVMSRTWPWPHTEWFRPYAAGFYAWEYLHEDLTRPEVEARLPELLALELVS
jgi:hypothetical protein